MAIRTSDLAFGQLPLQAERTAAAAHKPRHMVQLAFSMIELQNQRIAFAAIDTRRIGEDFHNERVIASIRGGAKRRCSDVEFRMLGSPVVLGSRGRCEKLMAVCAHDFAFCDLAEEAVS